MEWITCEIGNKNTFPKDSVQEVLIKYDNGQQKIFGTANTIIDLIENGWLKVLWLDESEASTPVATVVRSAAEILKHHVLLDPEMDEAMYNDWSRQPSYKNFIAAMEEYRNQSPSAQAQAQGLPFSNDDENIKEIMNRYTTIGNFNDEGDIYNAMVEFGKLKFSEGFDNAAGIIAMADGDYYTGKLLELLMSDNEINELYSIENSSGTPLDGNACRREVLKEYNKLISETFNNKQ